MLKNPLSQAFETIYTPNSDLNRIQDKIQELTEDLSENFQKNLFVLQFPAFPTGNPVNPAEYIDQPVYLNGSPHQPHGNNFESRFAHIDKSRLETPVFVGVCRGVSENEILEVSTFFHTSNKLNTGIILNFTDDVPYRVIGVQKGVGLLVPHSEP